MQQYRIINQEKREVSIPKELQTVLKNEQDAFKFFNSLSFSNKKEYIIWILSAKQEKTKQERLEKTVEKLKHQKKNPSEK
ncbi:MAG: YdeI/OmpD-associated family protein [Bacteroidetes bacterium]|nr:YdeI/OmpD-associated family protein [Bacteroidota bacterium]